MRHPYLEITSETALQSIKNFTALAKTIRSSSVDLRCWAYLLDQLNDPAHVRPVKAIDSAIIRTSIFNASTGVWATRSVNPVRGGVKQTVFTKKSSCTLLPPNGRIELFHHGMGENIGLLYDMGKCHIKPYYIFEKNINSDTKPWLKRKNFTEENTLRSISLHDLRKNMLAQIDQQGYVPKHNEILAGQTRESIIGIFTPENNLLHRVATLALRQTVKDQLNLWLPIFIITQEGDIQEYTPAMQEQDIHKVSLYSRMSQEYLYLKIASLIKTHFVENKPMAIVTKENFSSAIFRQHISTIEQYEKIIFILLQENHKEKWTVYSDVLRTSGEDSYYDKKTIKTIEISGFSLLLLFNSQIITELKILSDSSKKVSGEMIENTLKELHLLKKMFIDYSNAQYYWSSNALDYQQITVNQNIVDEVLEKLLTASVLPSIDYTANDKNSIRVHYLKKIHEANDQDSLEKVKIAIHKNSALKHRRYAAFDDFFKRSDQPTKTMALLQNALIHKEKSLFFSEGNFEKLALLNHSM